MERRNFLRSLAAAAIMGAAGAAACFRRSAENEDHAGAGLPAAGSQPAFQPERRSGHHRNRRRDHRHRRRRIEGHAVPVRRQVDWPGPAVHRTSLAGHEPRLLLSRRPREDPCHRRARFSSVGHQRKSPGPARARIAGRHGAQLLRMLQHSRHYSGHHGGHEHQGARPRHHRGRLSRLSLRRHGPSRQYHLQHPRARHSSSRRMHAGAGRRRARTAIG